ERCRVGRGKIPGGYGDAAEVFGGGAVGMHVTAGEHADPGCRCVEAVGHVPAVVDVVEHRSITEAVAAGAEAVPGALVHRPVHHHGLGHAGGHCHGGVHHRTAGGAAAVGHLGEEFDLFTAQQAGNLVFRHLVHGVGAEAVYFFRVDSGIGQGGQGGLHRQTQFGTA